MAALTRGGAEIVLGGLIAVEVALLCLGATAMLVMRSICERRRVRRHAALAVLDALLRSPRYEDDLAIRGQCLAILSELGPRWASRLLAHWAERKGAILRDRARRLFMAADLAREARRVAHGAPWLRLRAVRQALALGDPARVLAGLASDPVASVQLAAFEALCEVGRVREAVASLPALTEHGRSGRARAATALWLAPSRPVSELLSLDTRGLPVLEQLVIAGLAGCPGWQAMAVTCRALHRPHVELRIEALRTLRALGDPRALTECIAALSDPSWQVRSEATRTCVALGRDAVVEPLAGLLSDPVEWVRHNAANALARAGSRGLRALDVAAARGHMGAASARAQARLLGLSAAAPPRDDSARC